VQLIPRTLWPGLASNPSARACDHVQRWPSPSPQTTQYAYKSAQVWHGGPDVRRARPRTQKTAGSMALLPASSVMKLRQRKPRVKARSSSAQGLIPSICSGSKYTKLSSTLH
jgi:hypothetical protein